MGFFLFWHICHATEWHTPGFSTLILHLSFYTSFSLRGDPSQTKQQTHQDPNSFFPYIVSFYPDFITNNNNDDTKSNPKKKRRKYLKLRWRKWKFILLYHKFEISLYFFASFVQLPFMKMLVVKVLQHIPATCEWHDSQDGFDGTSFLCAVRRCQATRWQRQSKWRPQMTHIFLHLHY